MQIPSNLNTQGEEFRQNAAHQRQLLDTWQQRHQEILQGGGSKAQQRLREQGKLSARERIALLKDPGSELLELGAFAGYELYQDHVPAGGLITGIAMVHGRPVMVCANDATVKGGTYYPITVKKHLRAQAIARQNHLPCVYLVDSGGAFLPMQDEVFPDSDDFGRIFFNQAQMSAMGIPQISAVHGFCTAGGAYIPAMSDQSIIVEGTGSIFLAGPPLVKAATGEEVSVEELGGAHVHTAISGVADHSAENDEHAMLLMRDIISHMGEASCMPLKTVAPTPPAYDPEELLGLLPQDTSKGLAMYEVIARLVDGSRLFEFKKNYGKTLITGFAHIEGIPVGIIANNGVLFSESALKATHFIELCCQEQTPIVFLHNITGFMVGKRYEHGGIAKDGAKLVHAVANAAVPKISLVVGGSYGAGNYGMCGRAYDPRFLYMWPDSRIAVMGGEQAASVLATVKAAQQERQGKQLSAAELDQLKAPIREKYARESSAYYSSARLWDDGIISPLATRRVLHQSLCATLFHQWHSTKMGVLRM